MNKQVDVVELIVGFAVVLLVIFLLFFSYTYTNYSSKSNKITVTAKFPNADGISLGTDVRVSGVKVGSVVSIELDPITYNANVSMVIDKDLKLSEDTFAKVSSEGLLGSFYISLLPGAETVILQDGDSITRTGGGYKGIPEIVEELLSQLPSMLLPFFKKDDSDEYKNVDVPDDFMEDNDIPLEEEKHPSEKEQKEKRTVDIKNKKD